MLRIISSRASYGKSMTLSIPEVPAHTVELGLPRHDEAGHLGVAILQQVPELVRDDRRLDADLQLERERSGILDPANAPVRLSESCAAPVFVRERRQQAEIPAGKAVQQVGLEVQLAPRLVLRP